MNRVIQGGRIELLIQAGQALYYPATVMSELAQAGDSLFVARRPDRTLTMIVAVAGSTVEQELRMLFQAGDA